MWILSIAEELDLIKMFFFFLNKKEAKSQGLIDFLTLEIVENAKQF